MWKQYKRFAIAPCNTFALSTKWIIWTINSASIWYFLSDIERKEEQNFLGIFRMENVMVPTIITPILYL